MENNLEKLIEAFVQTATIKEINLCKRIVQCVKKFENDQPSSFTALIKELEEINCPYARHVPYWLIKMGTLRKCYSSKSIRFIYFRLPKNFNWQSIYPYFIDHKETKNEYKRIWRKQKEQVKKKKSLQELVNVQEEYINFLEHFLDNWQLQSENVRYFKQKIEEVKNRMEQLKTLIK